MNTQTNNRISVEIQHEVIEQCSEMLENIEQQLPFLIGLTPDERIKMPKINVANKVFVEDAYMAAVANKHVLPQYMQLDEMRKDIEAYNALDTLVLKIGQLADELRDTQMLLGSEAYGVALTVYRLMESASRDGVPGTEAAYRIMAERFKGQGKATQPAEPAQPPATEE